MRLKLSLSAGIVSTLYFVGMSAAFAKLRAITVAGMDRRERRDNITILWVGESLSLLFGAFEVVCVHPIDMLIRVNRVMLVYVLKSLLILSSISVHSFQGIFTSVTQSISVVDLHSFLEETIPVMSFPSLCRPS